MRGWGGRWKLFGRRSGQRQQVRYNSKRDGLTSEESGAPGSAAVASSAYTALPSGVLTNARGGAAAALQASFVDHHHGGYDYKGSEESLDKSVGSNTGKARGYYNSLRRAFVE